MTLNEAVELLNQCHMESVYDKTSKDWTITWSKDGKEVATAYFAGTSRRRGTLTVTNSDGESTSFSSAEFEMVGCGTNHLWYQCQVCATEKQTVISRDNDDE